MSKRPTLPLEDLVVRAMDGDDPALFPFLPYILQDAWQLGADPDIVAGLIRKHGRHYAEAKVLDVGCGKGAVTIPIAKEFHFACRGIDAIPEFIAEAEKKAVAHGVRHLCRFETGDIRERVNDLAGFDIIILGSIGPVLGDYFQTLTSLAPCLAEGGMFILDDGYIEDASEYTHPRAEKRSRMLRGIARAGMKIADEIVIENAAVYAAADRIHGFLAQRCEELIAHYPDKRSLLRNYLALQEREKDALATEIVCATMVIKKQDG